MSNLDILEYISKTSLPVQVERPPQSWCYIGEINYEYGS